LAKKFVSKSLYKQSDHKSTTDFFSLFVFSLFWAFLDEGISKTRKNNIKKINLTLVIFRTLTHPPTTGVTDFFLFGGPSEKNQRGEATAALFLGFPGATAGGGRFFFSYVMCGRLGAKGVQPNGSEPSQSYRNGDAHGPWRCCRAPSGTRERGSAPHKKRSLENGVV
jgi:hypothetical protein